MLDQPPGFMSNQSLMGKKAMRFNAVVDDAGGTRRAGSARDSGSCSDARNVQALIGLANKSCFLTCPANPSSGNMI